SAIVAASLYDTVQAENLLGRLRASAIGKDQLAEVEGRLSDWTHAYQRSGFMLPQYGGDAYGSGTTTYGSQTTYGRHSHYGSQGGGMGGGMGWMQGVQQGMPGQAPGMGGAARGDFVERQMVVVDVTILSTIEDNSSSMGVNLLDGLKLQFGNP